MNTSRSSKLSVLASMTLVLGLLAPAAPVAAFHDGGPVLLNSHTFVWVDPDSAGEIWMTENVFEGCEVDDTFIPHDMTWQWIVNNVSYDPIPGITNGFSGFQLQFPGPVAELYNQQSPTIGGPWDQNAFSGTAPPFGAEWDVRLPDAGIMPGETGMFSFCTFERMDVVVESEGSGSGPAGWAHTWGYPIPEPIIDADGTATPLEGIPGAVDVAVLDLLTSWPTGRYQEGLDLFDTDGNAAWTFGPAGDDLHVEDPVTHPGAIRDGVHDDFIDPIVLDLDGSLDATPGAEPVSCDMETGTFCAAGLPGDMAFFDTDQNGFWDDGEDIVFDANQDGIFGEVLNTQNFIFHGFQSVPGALLYNLDLDACSADHQVCKKVKYMDEDGDGVIEAGEPVMFLEVIQVHNGSDVTWNDVTVKDRWGAEIAVNFSHATHGIPVFTTKGSSEKVFLEWEIGDLAAGETANLVLMTMTDLNPGGNQSYTEPGDYEYNSGAVVKYRVEGKQNSFGTGTVWVSVLP